MLEGSKRRLGLMQSLMWLSWWSSFTAWLKKVSPSFMRILLEMNTLAYLPSMVSTFWLNHTLTVR